MNCSKQEYAASVEEAGAYDTLVRRLLGKDAHDDRKTLAQAQHFDEGSDCQGRRERHDSLAIRALWSIFTDGS